MRQILGAVSQYERALIRGRMLSGKVAKKAAGGCVGGKPPYGFEAQGGELVPDERESDLVALVHKLRNESASSVQRWPTPVTRLDVALASIPRRSARGTQFSARRVTGPTCTGRCAARLPVLNRHLHHSIKALSREEAMRLISALQDVERRAVEHAHATHSVF
jgi:hypothetical protein